MTLFVLFGLGLLIGSFLNVLADRLPRGQDIFFDRSRCDWCHKTLRPFELVPLLSYVIQNGKCRRCHHPLSLQYPLVELTTGLGFFTLGLSNPNPQLFLAETLILCPLIAIFVSDLKYQIIPDSLIFVAASGVLLLRVLRGELLQPNYWISGLVAAGFFYSLWVTTRKRGIGFGDVKLGWLLGFLLGYPKVVIGLYAGFLTGAVTGVILILVRLKKLKSKIALGPFLIWGSLVALVLSQQILSWWQKFL